MASKALYVCVHVYVAMVRNGFFSSFSCKADIEKAESWTRCINLQTSRNGNTNLQQGVV